MIWNHVVCWQLPQDIMKFPISLAASCLLAVPFLFSCSSAELNEFLAAINGTSTYIDENGDTYYADATGTQAATYDDQGVPIYGYQNGQAVYGYDASEQPVYDYQNLTSTCRVPMAPPRSYAPANYPRGIRKAPPPRSQRKHLHRPHPGGGVQRNHARELRNGARPENRRGESPAQHPAGRDGAKPGSRPAGRDGAKRDSRRAPKENTNN